MKIVNMLKQKWRWVDILSNQRHGNRGFHDICAIFSNFLRASPKQVQILIALIICEIGHLQNVLEDIFYNYTPQFVNKMHWLQLQYRVERNRQILVLVRIFRKNADKAVMKSAMYVLDVGDFDFL